jgi:6-phosphofructokinase 1
MTIGADSALHRITGAIDALASTAASHQRTFVVEVMGRHCGYLALMSAIATGGDWVLLPEEEMAPRWHNDMANALARGRAMGRRHEMVICAEGARHTDGLPISSEDVRRILAGRLGVDVRVTVLGHVQRGGAPSAFDRALGARLGAAAAAAAIAQLRAGEARAVAVGVRERGIETVALEDAFAEMDLAAGRPAEQWWWPLRDLLAILAQPEPGWLGKAAKGF